VRSVSGQVYAAIEIDAARSKTDSSTRPPTSFSVKSGEGSVKRRGGWKEGAAELPHPTAQIGSFTGKT